MNLQLQSVKDSAAPTKYLNTQTQERSSDLCKSYTLTDLKSDLINCIRDIFNHKQL